MEKFLKEGLTFDDVLLIPAKSEVKLNDELIFSKKSAGRFPKEYEIEKSLKAR
jgi:hypothetical protein